jgi:hypothetical protein
LRVWIFLDLRVSMLLLSLLLLLLLLLLLVRCEGI